MKKKTMDILIQKALKEPQKQIPKEKNTVQKIFHNKFLQWLEKNDFKRIFVICLKSTFCMIGGFGLFFPQEFLEFIIYSFYFRNFFILKFIFLVLIISQTERIFTICFNFWKNRTKNQVRECLEIIPKLFEVDLDLILHQLFNLKSFKLKEVCDLGMTKRNYEKLSKKLSEIGVIIKDKNKNNSFVFSGKFSLKEVSRILLDQKPIKELQKELSIEQINIDSPIQPFRLSPIS